ncbi:YfiR family protein [Sphingobium sufflavum]|uniref:YfiR family protein n=1 Tax=Sphingobium sufflavum TaxID=1129547 RepID=UPI001F4161C9|nr:YfiR family protein [Sphingobium sufflavum]MCE7797109.1 YfiR family protein [Sphingobium sufflavum]
MAYVARRSPKPGRLRWSGGGLVWAGAALATVLVGAPASASTPSLEQAVKASYLFKFAPFITWPDRALAGSKVFTICLSGDDPFGAVLDDVVRGQRIARLPIVVRRLGAATGGIAAGGAGRISCQMLFAGRGPQAGDYAPFADLDGQPVLTVTDAGAGPPGGMIRFVTQAGRIRFQIDDGAARANGLVISSKLLGLAVSVGRQ